MWNHEQKQKVKKNLKLQDSLGKNNFFFVTLPFSPWMISATWLHIEALQKILEK
jgi:hypothetical protein